MPAQFFKHATAEVSPEASIGDGTALWNNSQIRARATVGRNCTVGSGVFIDAEVSVGDNCKIENNALLFRPAKIARGVFIGPGVVLTNDRFPRAVKVDGTPKSPEDWQPAGVTVLEGASVGANATCIAPLKIGSWAVVGSGTVVKDDVPDFALVVGVPARRVGWVGKAGLPLTKVAPSLWECPMTGTTYREDPMGKLVEVERR